MINIRELIIVDYIIVVLIQLAASIQDIRTREISDWTWIIGAVICVPLGIYITIALHQLFLYVLSVIIGSVFALASYWLRAMGGADSKSIMFISASVPTAALPSMALTAINITPISVLINSLIMALIIYIPYNVIQNLRYGNNCDALSRVHGVNRAIYMAILMCVPAHRIFRNPNNYAISQELGEDGFKPVIRLGLSVDDPRELLVEWMSQGRISIDTPVLTSYHIPFIVPITLGLIMYLLINANMLTLIIMAL